MNFFFTTLFGLISALVILLLLDASTLFLAALMLSAVLYKNQNRAYLFDKVAGIWFALSVAPAAGVEIQEVVNLNNGFLLQSLLSFAFFAYFYLKKPSIIGRLYKSQRVALGALLSSGVAGFAGGILSGVTWQIYLQIASSLG